LNGKRALLATLAVLELCLCFQVQAASFKNLKLTTINNHQDKVLLKAAKSGHNLK